MGSSNSTAKSVSTSVSAASHRAKEYSYCLDAAKEAKKSASGSKMVTVLRKLRNLPKYKDQSGEELDEKAKSLVNPKEVYCYFSHLLDETLLDVIEEMADDKDDLSHSLEVAEAKRREQDRHRRAAIIPLKLELKEIKVLAGKQVKRRLISLFSIFYTDYGAKHVSLTVGDVRLEWGRESLVIPVREDDDESLSADRSHSFGRYPGEVRDATPHCPQNIAAHRLTPIAGAPLETYAEEADRLFTLVSEARPQLEALSELIVDYNTKNFYFVGTRNCQNFVRDALKCFGITAPLPPPGVRYTKDSKLSVTSYFGNHKELDRFVRQKSPRELEELDEESILFLQEAYTKFHAGIGCVRSGCLAYVIEDMIKNLK